ncbi:MAG: sigma-54-dependent Fis family transcriptional regulator [Kiritimatiellae bacterium]|nr:sigma-54-dependent Fis family transcriptional regulator [Kiritimatiellia bacterium]
MIRRVILALDARELESRLLGELEDPDTLVEGMGADGLQMERLSSAICDMIVLSRSLIPGPVTDTIAVLKTLPDLPAIVLFWDEEDAAERAQLLAAGCDAVLSSTVSVLELREALRAILQKREELAQKGIVEKGTLGKPHLDDFVSASPAMQGFMDIVRRVVRTDVTVLIAGETGVGKERLALAIHAEGRRSDQPFVAVNCGALPETLLESELFGHERGAFTGATRSRRGCFEVAHGGTLFLDEIGEMPYHLQIKLLRALQEREIQRVGAEQPIPVDVRVMAATNRDLAQAVEQSRFRRDLYYRLSVVRLHIPPLRDRLEDIPVLVESYLKYLAPRIGVKVASVEDRALDALCRYAWPGNVRELINVLERAMILADSDAITLAELPEEIHAPYSGGSAAILLQKMLGGMGPEVIPAEWMRKPLREIRNELTEAFERAYLSNLLGQTGGRIGKTAERAGIEARSLYAKMRKYGLRKESFRGAR